MRNRGYCGTLTVIQPLLGDERHRGNHSSRIQLPSLLGNFRELSDLHGSKVNPTDNRKIGRKSKQQQWLCQNQVENLCKNSMERQDGVWKE